MLVIFGVCIWLVEQIPMSPPILKTVVRVVLVLVLLLYLLGLIGVLPHGIVISR